MFIILSLIEIVSNHPQLIVNKKDFIKNFLSALKKYFTHKILEFLNASDVLV